MKNKGARVYPETKSEPLEMRDSPIHSCVWKLEERAGDYDSNRLIEAIQQGLPISEMDVLQNTLDIPLDKLAAKLGISKATLHRRKRGGRLGRDESDRVVRFARLVGKAVEVFGDRKKARGWLSAPQVGLGGAVPLDYAETEVGAREVEDLLGRIEYGVYS